MQTQTVEQRQTTERTQTIEQTQTTEQTRNIEQTRENLRCELENITVEEQQFLDGSTQITRDLYMSSAKDVIDAKKLLEAGKLISVRKHTRFVHFPKHTHNYVEVIYMFSGSTRHYINGKDVHLQQGELLFLNQHATQEVLPAGAGDIAVNFIILPEFFDYALKMMDTEENLLRDFVVEALQERRGTSGYLHFHVSDILPVQNLVENLIWTLKFHPSNKRSINQATMGLLFLQLMNYMDRVDTGEENPEQKLMLTVLGFIEEHYRNGELSTLAESLHYDLSWLSREIKKKTGKTYTELIQTKRMRQAAYLLEHTRLSVMDIAMAVGYENISYFHRIFQKTYGCTPRTYRCRVGVLHETRSNKK